MRLTSRWGLVVRALVASAVTLFVLSAVVTFVAVVFAAIALDAVADGAHLRDAPLAGLGAALVGNAVLFLAVRWGVRTERRQLLERTTPLVDFDGSRDGPAAEGSVAGGSAAEGSDSDGSAAEGPVAARPTAPDLDTDELAAASATAATARRLALRADVTVPAVRLHESDAPLAYTTYRPAAPAVRTGGAEPVLVVSRGLVRDLPEREREAVVAHEVAHLANADLRLLAWLLVPVVAAERIHRIPFDTLVTDGAHWLGQFATAGVGVFTRGRELAADRVAARLTGDPAALVAALERLDESASERPAEDLREHAASTSAVNVFPTIGAQRRWLTATHPPLETRREALRSMDV